MKKIISFLLIFTLLYLPILIGIDIYHGVDFYSAGTGQHVYFDASGEPWSFDSVSVNANYLEIDNGADSETFEANCTGGEAKFTIDVWDPDNTTQDAIIASWTGCSKYETYNTGEDSAFFIYDVNWRGQTFTPSITHPITSIKLLLYRSGLPRTITVSIRATDGDGKPIGDDLCSGTYDGDTVTTDATGAWYEITLGSGTVLSASTKYAIVVRITGGDAYNYIAWKCDGSSPTYSGGSYANSSDSGSTWNLDTSYDFMFEEGLGGTSVSYEITGLEVSQDYQIWIDGAYDHDETTDASGVLTWTGHNLDASYSIDIKYGAGVILGVSTATETFAIGYLDKGTESTSHSCTIENTGNVTENIKIKFSTFMDASSNTWTVGDTADADQCVIKWSIDDTNWNTIASYDSYVTVKTNLAVNDTFTLYVRITAPTSSTSYDEYSSTMTIGCEQA